VIRRGAEADIRALRAMMAGSNGYERPEELAMIQAYARDWWFRADDEVWVLADEAGVAGFLALVDTPHGWELDLFFTANDRQGQGVGARLFACMVERAKALGAAEVLIKSNPRAADFYRRMGAVDAGFDPPSVEIPYPRPIFRVSL
jgi:GNAT superfamily N-acetyltransferase